MSGIDIVVTFLALIVGIAIGFFVAGRYYKKKFLASFLEATTSLVVDMAAIINDAKD